jgi:hypothetical protein
VLSQTLAIILILADIPGFLERRANNTPWRRPDEMQKSVYFDIRVNSPIKILFLVKCIIKLNEWGDYKKIDQVFEIYGTSLFIKRVIEVSILGVP